MIHLTANALKDPRSLLDGDVNHLAPRLLAIAAIGAGIFGAVIGSYRGGIQMAFAAVKMPVLLLVPVIVALPAANALWRGCGVEVNRRRLAIASLTGLARTGVLAAAASPILWLLFSVRLDYHAAVMLMSVTLVLVGLPGLLTVRMALPDGGPRRWIATLGALLVVGGVTMQTGWLLRPFLARPTADIAFLRPVQADVFSSLSATWRSARGDYSGWEAEREGLLSQEQKP